MERRLWWIAIGLLALVGLATPLASAQSAQSVNVEITGVVLDVPDELPGVYEAGLEVTTKASGGHCACRQTTVDLEAYDVPEAVDAVVFSPSSFVVDWMAQPTSGGDARSVQVHIGVAEVPEDTSMLAVTIDADAESSNSLVEDRVQATQLALPLPDENTTTSQAAANSSMDTSEEGPGVSTAGIRSSSEVASDDDAGGIALGTGAATAGLALAGLTVHRYRQRP